MTDAKRLLSEATPLPWPDWDGAMGGLRTDGIVVTSTAGFSRATPSDAALIVHAVNRLPDYEAAVDALERVVAAWDTGKSTRYDPVLGPPVSDARIALRRLRDKVPA